MKQRKPVKFFNARRKRVALSVAGNISPAAVTVGTFADLAATGLPFSPTVKKALNILGSNSYRIGGMLLPISIGVAAYEAYNRAEKEARRKQSLRHKSRLFNKW